MNINFARSLAKSFSCPPIIYRNNFFKSFCPAITTNFFLKRKSTNDLRVRCFTIDSTLKTNKQDENIERKEDIKDDSAEKVALIFQDCKGQIFNIKGEVGKTVFEAAKEYGIALEGSCGGQQACSTCHVYVDKECEEILEPPSVEEDDLLDKASFPQENSRLACQLTVKKELEGRMFTLPKGTVNFYVDGHTPEAH